MSVSVYDWITPHGKRNVVALTPVLVSFGLQVRLFGGGGVRIQFLVLLCITTITTQQPLFRLTTTWFSQKKTKQNKTKKKKPEQVHPLVLSKFSTRTGKNFSWLSSQTVEVTHHTQASSNDSFMKQKQREGTQERDIWAEQSRTPQYNRMLMDLCLGTGVSLVSVSSLVCVSVCVFFVLYVHTWHGKSPTQQHRICLIYYIIAENQTYFDFSAMTLYTLVKIAKCAQYSMEALVPFFTQDAQHQVCFGL